MWIGFIRYRRVIFGPMRHGSTSSCFQQRVLCNSRISCHKSQKIKWNNRRLSKKKKLRARDLTLGHLRRNLARKSHNKKSIPKSRVNRAEIHPYKRVLHQFDAKQKRHLRLSPRKTKVHRTRKLTKIQKNSSKMVVDVNAKNFTERCNILAPNFL